MTAPSRHRLLGIVGVIAATACWSTSGIFISYIVEHSNWTAISLAFWRDLATFLVLLLVTFLTNPGRLRVPRRDLPWLAGMGVLSVACFHIFWNLSVLEIGASLSTIIQSTTPIFVSLAAWLLWREPLTRRKVMALMLAIGGMSLIAGVNVNSHLQITASGLVTALGAALAYSSLSLFGKKLSRDYSPFTTLTYAFGFAALALLPLQRGGALEWEMRAGALLAYAALVLLTTVTGFMLYINSLGRLPASVASIVSNTEVPFAAILAYIFLGERLGLLQILGAVLIILAVSLVAQPSSDVSEVEPQQPG
ncbi:MAG: DMT family transporter [Anaerolineales bacterium]|jgi:drug/metabolite transporter (DMT)-like permease